MKKDPEHLKKGEQEVARDIRMMRSYDVMSLSFLILETCYNDLWRTCCQIPKGNEYFFESIASSWSFIDTLHRIREVAHSVPTISQKSPEFRKFNKDTEVVKEFRNYVQHLRNELHKDLSSPVWGTLSWVDEKDPHLCYIAQFGSQCSILNHIGPIYDTHAQRYLSNVTLSVRENSFSFDPIYESAIQFKHYIVEEILKVVSGDITFSESIPIIPLRMVINSNDDSGLRSTSDLRAVTDRQEIENEPKSVS